MAWFDDMLRENARKNIIDEVDKLEQKMFEDKVDKREKEYFESLKKQNNGSGWCENCDCGFCRKHKVITIYVDITNKG